MRFISVSLVAGLLAALPTVAFAAPPGGQPPGNIAADVADLKARVAVLEGLVQDLTSALAAETAAREAADTTLQGNIDAEALARMEADATLQSGIDNYYFSLTAADTVLQGNINAEEAARTAADGFLQFQIDEIEPIVDPPWAPFVSFNYDTMDGLAGPHMIISGINVHIRSGAEATDDGGTTTGLGNLIIGYNEGEGDVLSSRGGSHNVIIGPGHAYNSHGGFVAGENNTVTGRSASVSGGSGNYATGFYSSVSGGFGNQAAGDYSSVSGGGGVNESGTSLGNLAVGDYSSVSGGARNIAGNVENTPDGVSSSVSGGFGNQAIGDYSSISGGQSNQTIGVCSSVSGGVDNEGIGPRSSVSGGSANKAIGEYSAASAGKWNWAEGEGSWVAGGGGVRWGFVPPNNVASGPFSSVTGGEANKALDHNSWIGGGILNEAGTTEDLDGDPYVAHQVVVGGRFNEAWTAFSGIFGAVSRTAVGGYDWWGGDLACVDLPSGQDYCFSETGFAITPP